MAKYKEQFSSLPRIEVKPGIVGDGLFVCEDVGKDVIIVEYKGNRIGGYDLQRMKASFDRHEIYPDVQAAVPSERTVIDPRRVGNEAQFVNHHCNPKAYLQQIKIGKK